MSGATVRLQGNSAAGVQTDAEGSYTLSFAGNNPEVVLEIVREGYEPQTVPVRLQHNENRTTYVEVVLTKEAIALEEVVVSDNPSLIANSEALSRKKLDKIPGGTTVANLKELGEKRSQTLKDALVRQPGVIIQEFFGVTTSPASISAARAYRATPNRVVLPLPKMVFLLTLPTDRILLGCLSLKPPIL